jgi:nucleoside 2-deoxyribosyltransferase
MQAANHEKFIYCRDMTWLRSSNVIVAEVTQPSLGVGYELGAAEALGIPVVCLFRTKSGRSLSAMLRGNKNFTIVDYSELEEVAAWLTDFFRTFEPSKVQRAGASTKDS